MEVSKSQDHVSHAVIGGQQTVDFGISSSAEFFHILSSTLYSDQPLAVVREVLCNAWDAHIEAGIDRPIEITIDEEGMTIKDYGKGIHQDDIGPIYGVYGNSTKKHDGQQTGGFGLGCKAPFSYTDNFEVTSCHDGIRTVYSMSKSSAEVHGKPGITPIASFPTIETGLTVVIMWLESSHRHNFIKLVRRVVSNGGIKAILNGTELTRLPYEDMTHGYMFTKETLHENNSNRIFIRYGNVLYQVDSHAAYLANYNRVLGLLSNLSNGAYNRYNLILQAQPHTISVTPSRESLSMQKHTIDTLSSLLENFINGIQAQLIDQCYIETDKAIDEKAKKSLFSMFFQPQSNLASDQLEDSTALFHITDIVKVTQAYLHRNYPNEPGFRARDYSMRFKALLRHKKGNARLIKSYVHLLKTVDKLKDSRDIGLSFKWFQKEIISGMKRSFAKLGADPKKLRIYDHFLQNLDYPDSHRYSGLHYMPFIRNVIILSHSSKINDDRLRYFPLVKEQGQISRCLVYVIPRHAKNLPDVRKMLNDRGMTLLDLTLDQAWEPKGVSAPKERVKYVKKEGLVWLGAAYDVSHRSAYNLERCRHPDADRITDFKFTVKIDYDSNRGVGGKIGIFNDLLTIQTIVSLFGSDGGVVVNSKQQESYLKKGVPDFMDYFLPILKDYICNSPTIKASYAVDFERISDGLRNRYDDRYYLTEMFFDNEYLADIFGLVSNKTDLDNKYLRLWQKVRERSHWDLNDDQKKIVNEIGTYLDSIKPSKQALKIIHQVENSNLIMLIDKDKIDYVFKNFTKNSPEYIKAIKLIKTALKG